MVFDSFSWISEFVSISFQSYCFFLFRGRKSLQLLMAVLCLKNLASIATHNMPWPYFYQLYFGRIAIALVGLWVVADVSCYPAKPNWTLRVPVAFAALLAIPYSPLNSSNGPGELDQYRLFCLGLAFFILFLHTVFLVVARQSITLQLLLLVALAVEVSGAAAMLNFGYHPRFQMFCWWVGLVALGSAQRTCNFGLTPLWSPSDPEAPARVQQSSTSACTGLELRLPLQSRLPRG